MAKGRWSKWATRYGIKFHEKIVFDFLKKILNYLVANLIHCTIILYNPFLPCKHTLSTICRGSFQNQSFIIVIPANNWTDLEAQGVACATDDILSAGVCALTTSRGIKTLTHLKRPLGLRGEHPPPPYPSPSRDVPASFCPSVSRSTAILLDFSPWRVATFLPRWRRGGGLRIGWCFLSLFFLLELQLIIIGCNWNWKILFNTFFPIF